MHQLYMFFLIVFTKLVIYSLANSIVPNDRNQILINKIFSNGNQIYKDLNSQNNRIEHVLNMRNKIKKKSLKKRKIIESLSRVGRIVENESFYKNFISITDVKNNQSRQYCGEALFYLVEYYCVFIKGTSVYSPDSDLDLVSVISRRQAHEGTKSHDIFINQSEVHFNLFKKRFFFR